MMKMLQIPLDRDIVHPYVIEQLHDGNTLSKVLLQRVSFDKGRYFALLHPSADPSKIYKFRVGGILPLNPLETVTVGEKHYLGRKKANSVSCLAEYLINAMQLKGCCYFEDLVHQKEDPIAVKYKKNTLYYRDEPYLFVQNEDFCIESIMKVIQYADAQWRYMNVVSEEFPGFSLDITEEKLQKIALETVCLVLGAYDMEGFIVWERLS